MSTVPIPGATDSNAEREAMRAALLTHVFAADIETVLLPSEVVHRARQAFDDINPRRTR